ncbi:MAG: hypothetical protein CHACPFDD_00797 [Phycisphaerae bacterium]|nr:hypothetical protein [Phycisphaerae bacterium]
MSTAPTTPQESWPDERPVIPAQPLPAGLARPLAQLRRRWRLYAAIAGAVRVSLTILATSLLQLLLDRWLRLSLDQRAALNGVLTLIWLWVFYRFLYRPLATPLGDVALASVVDGSLTEPQDQFATAVELSAAGGGDPESNSPALVAEIIGDACREAQRVSFLTVLNHRRAVQRGTELALQVAIVVLAFRLLPELMDTWFKRNWLLADIPWPQRTHLTPQGADASGVLRAPRGEEFRLIAQIDGEPPPTADVVWWTASGKRGRDSMTRVGDSRFESTFAALSEDLRFQLIGGDEHTREYRVQVVERPRVVSTQVHVSPPAYTGLPPFTVDRQPFVEAPLDSALRIEARANKPLAEARVVRPDGSTIACVLSGDLAVARLEPAEAGSYQFDLVDRDGWKDRNPLRFGVRLTADHAPSLKLALSGAGEIVTPIADIPVELTASDAYGLSAVELVTQRNEEPPVARSPPGAPTSQPASGPDDGAPPLRNLLATLRVDLATLGVAAGDTLRISARGTDNNPAQPGEGLSQTYALRVVSTDDFLTELARREYALRQEFERLLAAQRVVRDSVARLTGELATGRLEPRQLQRVASLARQQDQHTRRVMAIRQQFEQLLAEMWTNKIATAAAERRITDAIVTPLGELARRLMPAGRDALLRLKMSATADERAAASDRQDEIVRSMQAVLAQMLQWEGYREAVALLREIIAEQTDLRAGTLSAINSQLDDILGLEQPPAVPPTPAPAPR